MRAIAVLALIGCGGGGPNGGSGTGSTDIVGVEIIECTDAFAACGGDVVGGWHVEAMCDPGLDPSALNCPDATYAITADRTSGSVDILADGSYYRNYDIDVDVEIVVPKTCLMGMGCDLIPPASGGLISACVDTGDACECAGTYTSLDSASGTWVMEGNTLVTDGTDRTDVCVRGNYADSLDQANGARAIWKR